MPASCRLTVACPFISTRIPAGVMLASDFPAGRGALSAAMQGTTLITPANASARVPDSTRCSNLTKSDPLASYPQGCVFPFVGHVSQPGNALPAP